jgi:DNA/RNA-binding domain of Phe-tRNA-synthetase-like protein
VTAFSIAPLVERFPDAVIAAVIAEGIRAVADALPALDQLIEETRRAAGARFAGRELGDVPELSRWRRAYKAFGVRGTSHRCSVERLVRMAQREESTRRRVAPLVDVYNLVSLRHVVPVGADDLDKVEPPLAFRTAAAGDHFVPLGSATGAEEPPEPGEVVYADAVRILCRRWNWYQSAETAISEHTTRAVLTVQGLGPDAREVVAGATQELDELLTRVCGSRQAIAILDRASPTVRFGESDR